MSSLASSSAVTRWVQRSLRLPAKRRGCHYVTEDVLKALPELAQCRMGTLHIFCKHTSASLCLNESWDGDVKLDMEDSLNRLAPENAGYRHSCEGPDDMPGHVKSALLGVSVTIPVSDGALALGTWQGLWLCEHRNAASGRTLVLTLNGLFH